MATKGYTTVGNVASQLGRTLTADQQTYLTDLVLPATEQWIDVNGGRSYGEQPVVAEQLIMSGPYTWLSKAPVVELTAVRGWFYGQTVADEFVVDPAYYSLLDPNAGYLYLPDWQSYAHLEADYTPDDTIPDNIRLAATIVAGVFMRTVLHPASEWLTDYASAQDVRLKFRALEVPDIVMTLLGSSVSGVTVA